MPDLDIKDMKALGFPSGMREQYSALAWESQRQYFLLMVIAGAGLFLLGAVL